MEKSIWRSQCALQMLFVRRYGVYEKNWETLNSSLRRA